MYFKKVKSTIEQCAKEENVKPLGECENTNAADDFRNNIFSNCDKLKQVNF